MKNENSKIAALVALALLGAGAPSAVAAEAPQTIEEFHAAVQEEAEANGLAHLTKDELLDHLVQAAQEGCRCCGRCRCK